MAVNGDEDLGRILDQMGFRSFLDNMDLGNNNMQLNKALME